MRIEKMRIREWNMKVRKTTNKNENQERDKKPGITKK